jgi:monovalent cation:H+ antiporter, CPA1 family
MLVVGGVVVANLHWVPVPQLNPDLLLFALLPPLLFEAAFRIDDRELRVLARPLLVLAVPGTFLTAILVGAALAVLLQIPLLAAFLFGSIVAATDPVAVVPVFRRLGAPRHLSVIAEGESLVNDGVAITLYTAFLGLALGGSTAPTAAVELFLRQAVGGVVLGCFLGFAALAVTSLIDDYLLEMTLSTALAYGSYLAAQNAGMSGALACVSAGVIHGSLGRGAGMTEANRRLIDDLWEYFGFLANALVFLLLGLTVDLLSLTQHAAAIGVAIAVVIVARAAVIDGLRLVPGGAVAHSAAERALLTWGGLRGALTAALALALLPTTPARDLLVALAFGVVLFTLVVQGATLPLVVRRLGLAHPRHSPERYRVDKRTVLTAALFWRLADHQSDHQNVGKPGTRWRSCCRWLPHRRLRGASDLRQQLRSGPRAANVYTTLRCRALTSVTPPADGTTTGNDSTDVYAGSGF